MELGALLAGIDLSELDALFATFEPITVVDVATGAVLIALVTAVGRNKLGFGFEELVAIFELVKPVVAVGFPTLEALVSAFVRMELLVGIDFSELEALFVTFELVDAVEVFTVAVLIALVTSVGRSKLLPIGFGFGVFEELFELEALVSEVD
jgi:hypothetical protein